MAKTSEFNALCDKYDIESFLTVSQVFHDMSRVCTLYTSELSDYVQNDSERELLHTISAVCELFAKKIAELD